MKKILLGLGGIIGLLLLVAVILVFVTPGDYKVEREIVINKPKSDVYNYAKMLKNQNTWGPWVKKDPNIKMDYKGNDGEIGYIIGWDSQMENVGAGEQEIKKLVDGSRIDTEIRFKKPFESTNNAFMILEEATPTSTKVKWGFTGSMQKPMNLLLLTMDMDKEVGKDFNEGLTNLKTILEKQ